MKKLIVGAILLTGLSAYAQETYNNAIIATEDLNGTARYVGMGGAMEALGADISTISTNPAGVGMFRRSQVSLSAGLVSQANAAKSAYNDATNASFDQIGGVWSQRVGRTSFLNIGFNYHKSRNFNNILGVEDALNGASQNKISYYKAFEGLYKVDKDFKGNSNMYSQVDYLYNRSLLIDKVDNKTYYYEGDRYVMDKAQKGYVGSYDFNVSGNVADRVYLGLTMGIKDVNYESYTSYYELLQNNFGSVELNDHSRITGSGFDVKLGAIIFPIENSAFRIGASVSTPTFYDLNVSNYTTLANRTIYGYGANETVTSKESYDFKIFTPWKFGLSLGHTVNGTFALGASYEFADYSSIRSRIINGTNYYGETSSYNDLAVNNDTKASLNGVHTLKLGTEYKLVPNWAVRIGYNFVSPIYKVEAFRSSAIDSPGTYYASTTDYVNWKATNRLTVGTGYSASNFAFDVAYQYSATKGEFAPFMSYDDKSTAAAECVPSVVNVNNNRHQLLATFTYKF